MDFYVHQDGYVVIKDAVILYQDSIENFNLDSGLIISLPENMVAIICVNDVTTYYDAKQNAHPIEGSYCPDVVKSAITNVNAICAAKITREQVGL